MATATKVMHTPGPWSCNQRGLSVFATRDLQQERIAKAELLRAINGDDASAENACEEEQANAHLIAAAPDMFHALELEQFVEELKATHDPRDIIRLLESRGDYESGHMDPLGVIDHYQTLAALARETALARARGEAA